MIVRISGEGQYELDEGESRQLDALDDDITAAIRAGDEARFHETLHRAIEFIRRQGSEVSPDRVVPSQVIIPPDDVSLDEARRFFEDDSRYTQPVSP